MSFTARTALSLLLLVAPATPVLPANDGPIGMSYEETTYNRWP